MTKKSCNKIESFKTFSRLIDDEGRAWDLYFKSDEIFDAISLMVAGISFELVKTEKALRFAQNLKNTAAMRRLGRACSAEAKRHNDYKFKLMCTAWKLFMTENEEAFEAEMWFQFVAGFFNSNDADLWKWLKPTVVSDKCLNWSARVEVVHRFRFSFQRWDTLTSKFKG